MGLRLLTFWKDSFFFLVYVYMCVFESMYIHNIHVGAHVDHKKVLDSLELDLQIVGSHLIRCWYLNLGPPQDR